MAIEPSSLPDFDIMLGGFPCQSFSVMGQREGMADARGQIILGLANILREKNPSHFLLENVKGLISHDGGNTLRTITRLLEDCGYRVSYQLMRSVEIGIPQMRERVFLAGTRDDLPDTGPIRSPTPRKLQPLRDFLIDTDPTHVLDLDSPKGRTFLGYLNNRYNAGQHNLADYLREEGLVLDTRQSDLRLYRDVVPTLRTGRHGILYVRNGQLRSLSGFESLLLQGVPQSLARRARQRINNRALLSQAGNAMTVPVVEEVARQMFACGEVQPAATAPHAYARSYAVAA